MADDLNAALRALANRWAMKARDFARDAKAESASESQKAYDRGFAEAYYRAATELAELLKEQGGTGTLQAAKPVSSAPAAGSAPQRPAAPASPAAAAPPKPAPKPEPPAPTYAAMPLPEAYSLLEYAGCHAREVTPGSNNTFHAVFSRWENMMPHDRLEKIQKADPRIVIVASGKLETHDHFVDFAFKDG
jgi:hypothetical protein